MTALHSSRPMTTSDPAEPLIYVRPTHGQVYSIREAGEAWERGDMFEVFHCEPGVKEKYNVEPGDFLVADYFPHCTLIVVDPHSANIIAYPQFGPSSGWHFSMWVGYVKGTHRRFNTSA